MATLAKTTRSTTYTLASSTAGPFLVGYRIMDNDAVEVYVNGVKRTDWTLSATYTNGFSDGASITFSSNLGTGNVLVIESSLTPGRSQNYASGDPSLTSKLNIELGRIWQALADLHRDAGRSLRILSKPQDKVPAAPGKILGFDGGGQIVSIDMPTVSPPEPGGDGRIRLSDYDGNIPNFATAVSATDDKAGLIDGGTWVGAFVSNSLPDNSTIEGAGPLVTTFQRSGATNAINAIGAQSFTLRNLTVDVDRDGLGTRGHGIAVTGGEMVIDGVNVRDFGSTDPEDASVGILAYGIDDAIRQFIRVSNSRAEASAGSDNGFGIVIDDAEFSQMYGNHVSRIVKYGHEVKDNSQFNVGYGLTAFQTGKLLGFGHEGTDGASYNVFGIAAGKAVDGAIYVDRGDFNVFAGVLGNSDNKLAAFYSNADGVRWSNGSNGNVAIGVSLVGAEWDRPVYYDNLSENNFTSLAYHGPNTDIVYLQPGARRNATEVTHPGNIRDSILGKIFDDSGFPMSGNDGNPTWCHATGEYIGSLSGTFHQVLSWAGTEDDISWDAESLFRHEHKTTALLGLGVERGTSNKAGISVNTLNQAKVGAIQYNFGDLVDWSEDDWTFRIDQTNVLRIKKNVILPLTEGNYDIGASATRFRHVYADRLEAAEVANLRPLIAEPSPSIDGSLAHSDGTSSTNGFGVAGKGIYYKNGSTWTKLDGVGPNGIVSDTTGITGATQITNIVAISQANYDAIVTPDPSTFYVITG